MPEFYPIFLNLKGKRCLVAGLGKVGARKLAGLLDAGCARVDVFDIKNIVSGPETCPYLQDSRVVLHHRPCAASDLENCFLAFAATNDKEENERIAKICLQKNILCDCVSNPDLSSFISPAVARAGGLRAALSTGGHSPFLAGKWRRELEQWLAPRAGMAWLLGKLRPLVLAASQDSAANAEFLKKIASSPLEDWLASHELARCREWLNGEFPPESHAALNHILNEYEHNFC